MMNIGVVSDTHGFLDPRLKRLLEGVTAILHAGDVGRGEVLAELREIAPVHAVRGNVDSSLLELPLSLTLMFDKLQVQLMHILPAPQRELEAWSGSAMSPTKALRRREMFTKSFDEATRLVIFGHSHTPCLVNLAGRLFLNPGSAGKKRLSLPRSYARLEVLPERVTAEIELLESYDATVPAKMGLDFAFDPGRALRELRS